LCLTVSATHIYCHTNFISHNGDDAHKDSQIEHNIGLCIHFVCSQIALSVFYDINRYQSQNFHSYFIINKIFPPLLLSYYHLPATYCVFLLNYFNSFPIVKKNCLISPNTEAPFFLVLAVVFIKLFHKITKTSAGSKKHFAFLLFSFLFFLYYFSNDLAQSFSFSLLHNIRQCHHSFPSFLSVINIPSSKTPKASLANLLSSLHWSLGQYLSV